MSRIETLGGPVRAEPIPFAGLREAEERRLEERKRGGWLRAYARGNQMLPYGGTGLTPGEAAVLGRELEHRAAVPGKDRVGAALLSAVMTTGRNAGELAELGVEEEGRTAPAVPTLVLGDRWTWWLRPPGIGTSQLLEHDLFGRTVERAELTPLPCSARTRLLLEAVGVRPGGPLFPAGEEAARVLRGAIRAAGLRVPASHVASWLFQRLAAMEGGDVALAAIVTGRRPVIARSVLHYTAVRSSGLAGWLGRALDGFDAVGPGVPEDWAETLGSRFAPGKNEVRSLMATLAAPLRRPGRRAEGPPDRVAEHNALTLYTAVFFLFATGCRPPALLELDPDAVDERTGFLLVDDKTVRGDGAGDGPGDRGAPRLGGARLPGAARSVPQAPGRNLAVDAAIARGGRRSG